MWFLDLLFHWGCVLCFLFVTVALWMTWIIVYLFDLVFSSGQSMPCALYQPMLFVLSLVLKASSMIFVTTALSSLNPGPGHKP